MGPVQSSSIAGRNGWDTRDHQLKTIAPASLRGCRGGTQHVPGCWARLEEEQLETTFKSFKPAFLVSRPHNQISSHVLASVSSASCPNTSLIHRLKRKTGFRFLDSTRSSPTAPSFIQSTDDQTKRALGHPSRPGLARSYRCVLFYFQCLPNHFMTKTSP